MKCSCYTMFLSTVFTLLCACIFFIIVPNVQAHLIKERAIEAQKSCEKSGYKLMSNGCYKYHATPLTWNKAYWTCMSEGAYLVVINNIEEMRLLKRKNMLQNPYGTHVGLQYNVESQKWSSLQGDMMENLYNKWVEGSPPQDEILTCGVMMSTLKLINWPCDGEYGIYQPFICEKTTKL
ncbi:hemolymph lipopolysaccharide-binding protein-like [Anticarsia gemmatalis]|uniref:hemolymph lipopolysaccharide-binding protein-like n=1 Tax=Anticarsia gemmatalis TaxID=129554 RepID=UPI003F76D434